MYSESNVTSCLKHVINKNVVITLIAASRQGGSGCSDWSVTKQEVMLISES